MCHSATAQQLRDALFTKGFLERLGLVLLPFPVFWILILLVTSAIADITIEGVDA